MYWSEIRVRVPNDWRLSKIDIKLIVLSNFYFFNSNPENAVIKKNTEEVF